MNPRLYPRRTISGPKSLACMVASAMAEPETPHEEAQKDAHLGEPAPHEPRRHVGEAEEPPGHAQLVHQVAGQDEGGDGQEGEVLGLRQGQLHGHGELKPGLGEEEDEPPIPMANTTGIPRRRRSKNTAKLSSMATPLGPGGASLRR